MIRVLFWSPKRKGFCKKPLPAAYFGPYFGDRYEFKVASVGKNFGEAHGDPMCLFLDGKRIAYLNHLNQEWIVNWKRHEYCAQRLTIDTLPFTLEGRVFPTDDHDCEETQTPCIFCGKLVKHINGGGNAWAGSTDIRGVVEHFLYCNAVCGEKKTYEQVQNAIWTCITDSIDLVGDACWVCKKTRSEADRDLFNEED